MLKVYDAVEIEVVYFNDLDIVTASGDNYTDDPWDDFEY